MDPKNRTTGYTDQGSQFTDGDFIATLERSGAQISMDGKGCWRDNVFVERLWRSVKYEEAYLHAYDDVPQARRGIGDYFGFFNDERPHQTLGYSVPIGILFLVTGGVGEEGGLMPTGDSQQFTVCRSPPAPPSADKKRSDGDRGLRPRIQIGKKPEPEQSPRLRDPFRGPDDGVHPFNPTEAYCSSLLATQEVATDSDKDRGERRRAVLLTLIVARGVRMSAELEVVRNTGEPASPADVATAVQLLKDLLAKNDGCLSSVALRQALESRGIANARDLVLTLRYFDFDAATDDGPYKPPFRWYCHAKSFYSKERFEKLQNEKDLQATKVAEEAASTADTSGPIVIPDLPRNPDKEEEDATVVVPERRRNRQEEGRLSTYVESALQDIYQSDCAPEDAECVFDVHNERAGNEYENVDLIAVHWRSEQTVEIVAVEVKLEFTSRLIQQARNYSRFADRVWIAVPVRADPTEAASELRDSDPLLFEHVVAMGLGILACRRRTGRSYEVVPIHWPSRTSPDSVEREHFFERYRTEFEKAAVLAPRGGRRYPKFS